MRAATNEIEVGLLPPLVLDWESDDITMDRMQIEHTNVIAILAQMRAEFSGDTSAAEYGLVRDAAAHDSATITFDGTISRDDDSVGRDTPKISALLKHGYTQS